MNHMPQPEFHGLPPTARDCTKRPTLQSKYDPSSRILPSRPRSEVGTNLTHLIERRIIHDIILITLEHRHGGPRDPLHIGVDDERRVVRHRHVDAGWGIVLAQEEDVAASPAEPDGDDLVATELSTWSSIAQIEHRPL
jgi:hypothetical protein